MNKKNQGEWPIELVGEIMKGMAFPYLRELLFSLVRENEFRYHNLISTLESTYGKKRASEIIKRIENSGPSLRYENLGIPEFDRMTEKQKDSLTTYIKLREKILKYLCLDIEKYYGGDGTPK